MTQKVVFLGSKSIGFQTFQLLIKKQNELDIELVGLLTRASTLSQSEESLESLATQNNIPILDSLAQLKDLPHIDYLISVQYHEILKAEHIALAKKVAVNLHMAPVPEYRGCNQFSFAIVDGATEFGTTIHVISEGIDSGDILFEKRFPIDSDDTVQSLQEKTVTHSFQLFVDSIEDLFSGNYNRTSQAEYKGKRAFGFHTRKEIETLKQIDLAWSEKQIDNHIRATFFPPFPPPFAIVEGRKIELSPDWKNDLKREGISYPIA